jgi:hypothetical protein
MQFRRRARGARGLFIIDSHGKFWEVPLQILGRGENFSFILEKGGEIREPRKVAQKIRAKWEERGQGENKKKFAISGEGGKKC